MGCFTHLKRRKRVCVHALCCVSLCQFVSADVPPPLCVGFGRCTCLSIDQNSLHLNPLLIDWPVGACVSTTDWPHTSTQNQKDRTDSSLPFLRHPSQPPLPTVVLATIVYPSFQDQSNWRARSGSEHPPSTRFCSLPPPAANHIHSVRDRYK